MTPKTLQRIPSLVNIPRIEQADLNLGTEEITLNIEETEASIKEEVTAEKDLEIKLIDMKGMEKLTTGPNQEADSTEEVAEEETTEKESRHENAPAIVCIP